MVNPIPKWVMKRYSKLWKKYNRKTFTYEDIKKVLTVDDTRMISVFINELRKANWIEIQLDKEDTRKRIYQLKSPNLIVEQIAELK